jgi:hypothetical protein
MGDLWTVLASWAGSLITSVTGNPEFEASCLAAMSSHQE